MKAKTTDELAIEIKSASDVGIFLQRNKPHMLSQNLTEHLAALLEQKGASKSDVVKDSLLDRTYTYQIFSGIKTPSRDKLIAIAFGLGLTSDETQTMLKLSGNRELYSRDERDALILFMLEQRKDIRETNTLLHAHDFDALGVSEKGR